MAQYYALVKDLNPERKSWDTLNEGEIIRLPSSGQSTQVAAAPAAKPPRGGEGATPESRAAMGPRPGGGVKSAGEGTQAAATPAGNLPRPAESRPSVDAKTAAPTLDPRQAMQGPAKEQMALFARVAEAIGGEVQNSGEEVVAIKDGSIRLDRGSYPVVYSPALRQKVVIDPDGKIPASLRSRLADPAVRTPIVPMANGLSIREAVGQLLAGLGISTAAGRPAGDHSRRGSFLRSQRWLDGAGTGAEQ